MKNPNLLRSLNGTGPLTLFFLFALVCRPEFSLAMQDGPPPKAWKRPSAVEPKGVSRGGASLKWGQPSVVDMQQAESAIESSNLFCSRPPAQPIPDCDYSANDFEIQKSTEGSISPILKSLGVARNKPTVEEPASSNKPLRDLLLLQLKLCKDLASSCESISRLKLGKGLGATEAEIASETERRKRIIASSLTNGVRTIESQGSESEGLTPEHYKTIETVGNDLATEFLRKPLSKDFNADVGTYKRNLNEAIATLKPLYLAAKEADFQASALFHDPSPNAAELASQSQKVYEEKKAEIERKYQTDPLMARLLHTSRFQRLVAGETPKKDGVSDQELIGMAMQVEEQVFKEVRNVLHLGPDAAQSALAKACDPKERKSSPVVEEEVQRLKKGLAAIAKGTGEPSEVSEQLQKFIHTGQYQRAVFHEFDRAKDYAEQAEVLKARNPEYIQARKLIAEKRFYIRKEENHGQLLIKRIGSADSLRDEQPWEERAKESQQKIQRLQKEVTEYENQIKTLFAGNEEVQRAEALARGHTARAQNLEQALQKELHDEIAVRGDAQVQELRGHAVTKLEEAKEKLRLAEEASTLLKQNAVSSLLAIQQSIAAQKALIQQKILDEEKTEEQFKKDARVKILGKKEFESKREVERRKAKNDIDDAKEELQHLEVDYKTQKDEPQRIKLNLLRLRQEAQRLEEEGRKLSQQSVANSYNVKTQGGGASKPKVITTKSGLMGLFKPDANANEYVKEGAMVDNPKGEVLAYLMDRKAGYNLVPLTFSIELPDRSLKEAERKGSIQLWVPHTSNVLDHERFQLGTQIPLSKDHGPKEVGALAVRPLIAEGVNFINRNKDSHLGNFLFFSDDPHEIKRPIPIDHSKASNYYSLGQESLEAKITEMKRNLLYRIQSNDAGLKAATAQEKSFMLRGIEAQRRHVIELRDLGAFSTDKTLNDCQAILAGLSIDCMEGLLRAEDHKVESYDCPKARHKFLDRQSMNTIYNFQEQEPLSTIRGEGLWPPACKHLEPSGNK